MIKKRGQEEIVGFVLIIILVSVILLIFLSFSLRNSKGVEIESYEVEGFIQAFLQHTSDCEDALGFLSMQQLIFSCDSNEMCLDERNTCAVMESTLKEICKASWNAEGDSPIKGYNLRIVSDDTELFLLQEGNITQNYKGAAQDFVKRGRDYGVSFQIYYS
jgi:hypothetical protein